MYSGKRVEAIQEVGARLEWWSKEPELSMAESDMFGLVPGEDKLFANAILLRLADTFISGDKQTKLCVVKAFLWESKHRKMKSYNRNNEGILSRYKVENHLELLRRVKVCYNSGDEDVRAMALVLFGCWSNFAKDNADIRYLILSSIVSSHALEVRTKSLFMVYMTVCAFDLMINVLYKSSIRSRLHYLLLDAFVSYQMTSLVYFWRC